MTTTERIRHCFDWCSDGCAQMCGLLPKPSSRPETNPSDCSCEFTHASTTYCKSRAPSRGAVTEAQRMFPAGRDREPGQC